MFAQIRQWVATHSSLQRRHRAYGELAALSERTLKDMGLHHSGIRAIVEGLDDSVQRRTVPQRRKEPNEHAHLRLVR